MNQQAERRVATVIGGKWRVDALLGSGSMAAVYAVTHRNGARAALKILHPTLCTDPAVCERFLGEGYLANSVKHQGIVRVLDDGITDDGCVFLVMDLLEGETLEGLRQKRGGRIPLVETLDLADKLMDVLSAVHNAGIIHRDLKPQNVFVCHDGTVKLLDFGVARVFDRTSQSKLSMFGLVLGTPSFMSPEQALGSRDKVDHRSDIWSLGATIFTALTGETVHLGANVQAKLLAAATVKARSIAMVMPDLPAPLSAAIDMALRFKKEDRWQTVDAMRRALRDARVQLGLGKPQSIAPPPFDMSLDESTHVDKGAPKAPSFDSTTTIKNTAPPAGPDGTFIGMGGESGATHALVGNDGSVPPAAQAQPQEPPPRPITSHPPPMRPRIPSGPPTPGMAFGQPYHAPAPSPAAIVRRAPSVPDATRGSRPDGAEASIPAYGGTVKIGVEDSVGEYDPTQLGGRRKSSVGVWLVAVVLAAAALGGIAFFAVKRGPLARPSPAAPGYATSATVDVAPQPTAPSTAVLVPQPTSAVTTTGSDTRAGASDAAAPVRTAATLTPPWRPQAGGFSYGGGGHTSRSSSRTSGATPDPTPPAPDAPKPTPTQAPDPFATPE